MRITASGGRTYLCQYTLHGHKWRVPLGACSAVPLAKARQAAASIMGDVAKGRNPAADRKEAAAAERAKRARNRLTLRVLIDDWNRLHLADRRPSYAAEAVRALHYAFEDRLDDAAEDLDRAGVVRALDTLTRRGQRKDGDGTSRSKGGAIRGRTAAYGRAAYAWATKRGAVQVNPFANLPVAKSVTKRERVLSDRELAEVWQATGEASAPYGTSDPAIDPHRAAPQRSSGHDVARAFRRFDYLDHTGRAYQKRRHPRGAPQRTSSRLSQGNWSGSEQASRGRPCISRRCGHAICRLVEIKAGAG